MTLIDIISPEFLEKLNQVKALKEDPDFFLQLHYLQEEFSKDLAKCRGVTFHILNDHTFHIIELEEQLNKQDLLVLKEYMQKRTLREKLKKRHEKVEKKAAKSFNEMNKHLSRAGIDIEQIEKTNTLIGTRDCSESFGVTLDVLRKQTQ